MLGIIFAIISLVGLELIQEQHYSKRIAQSLAAANITTTITAAATATPTTTVTVTGTHNTAQPMVRTTDLPLELPDCDFHLLYGGASALEPPFDVAESINLRQWQAAWRQFSELTRLIDIHRSLLIYKHGAKEFKSFREDLGTLVEKPLRYGCSTLQRLQVVLLEFKHINIGQNEEQRAILSHMLRETEISIINNTLGTTITHLLPSWAREAPELRSDKCPSQDCFKIGETALDIAMLQIPIELINGVRTVQSGIAIGGTYATKGAGGPVFGTMTPWGRVTALMPDVRSSDVNSEQWVTPVALLGALVVFILSARRVGQRPGLLWLLGLSLVIIAISWPQEGLESLGWGNFTMSNQSFTSRR